MAEKLSFNKVINSIDEPLTPEIAENFIHCLLEGNSSRKISLPTDKMPKDDINFDLYSSLENKQIEIIRTVIDRLKNLVGNIENIENITPQFLAEKGIDTTYFSPNKEELSKLFSMSDEDFYNVFINEQETSLSNTTLYILDSMSNLLAEHTGKESIFKGDQFNKHYQSRIYLNTPTSEIGTEFITEFAKKCIARNIPHEMKGLDKISNIEGKDKTVLYSHTDFLLQHIEILEEISKEHPEWIKEFGTPIHTGGAPKLNSKTPWYGIGYTPVNQENGATLTETYNDFIDHAGRLGLVSVVCKHLSKETKNILLKKYNEQNKSNISLDLWDKLLTQMAELSSNKEGGLMGVGKRFALNVDDFSIPEPDFSAFFIQFLSQTDGLNFSNNFDKLFPQNSKLKETFVNEFIAQTEKAVSRSQSKERTSIYISAEMYKKYQEEKELNKEEINVEKGNSFMKPLGDLPKDTLNINSKKKSFFRPLTSEDLTTPPQNNKSTRCSHGLRPLTSKDLDR